MDIKPVPEEMVKIEDESPGLNPLCTRRQILIWGGVSIIGLSALSPALASGTDSPLIILDNAQGIVIADPVLCVGCGRCELACTEFNDGKASPSLSRIKIDRNLNFGPQGPTIWRKGHGNFGDGLIVQDLCKQCPHPVPCANICPENAIVLAPGTNARIIDQEKCIGCKLCLQACPWEMISYDPDKEIATKCHLCQGKPKCVEACPAGALSYVSWRDLTGKTPPRNPKASMLPPQRMLNCQGCHMPGLSQNVRQTITMMKRGIKGRMSASSEKIGLKWIDLAGVTLIPLAIGSVLIHAILRRITRR